MNERKSMVMFKKVYRLTIFVPPEHLEKLLNGVMEIAPLAYGRYDKVAWWSSPGIEQFRPLPGSNPTTGGEDRISREASTKLEFSIDRDPDLLRSVIENGILPNHPWEEPVILVSEVMETRVHTES